MPRVPLNDLFDFDIIRVPPLGKTCHSCFRARRYRVIAKAPNGQEVRNDYCEEHAPAQSPGTIADTPYP